MAKQAVLSPSIPFPWIHFKNVLQSPNADAFYFQGAYSVPLFHILQYCSTKYLVYGLVLIAFF